MKSEKEMINPEAEEETECANCGMTQSEWPDENGYIADGETYCCQGCADESGCTCT